MEQQQLNYCNINCVDSIHIKDCLIHWHNSLTFRILLVGSFTSFPRLRNSLLSMHKWQSFDSYLSLADKAKNLENVWFYHVVVLGYWLNTSGQVLTTLHMIVVSKFPFGTYEANSPVYLFSLVGPKVQSSPLIYFHCSFFFHVSTLVILQTTYQLAIYETFWSKC